ncbi:MAG TPA: DUF1330 domain-containing protein [Gammaproteobacteria bacterium]
MSAYLIADISIHDADRYKEYVANVPVLIEKHGGSYLVRGGDPEALEGDWIPSRVIILEFPNKQALEAFYNDPEYAPYRQLRQAVTESRLVAVEGCV